MPALKFSIQSSLNDKRKKSKMAENKLERAVFEKSRELEFLEEKELEMKLGSRTR